MQAEGGMESSHNLFSVRRGPGGGADHLVGVWTGGLPCCCRFNAVCLSPPQSKGNHLLGLGVLVPGPGSIEGVWGV